MKHLADVDPCTDVAAKCARCEAPLRLLALLFGRRAVEYHAAQHKRDDQCRAAAGLLAAAEAVANGEAPPIILKPAALQFRLAFDVPITPKDDPAN